MAQRVESCLAMRSGRSSSGGLGVRKLAGGWRFAAGFVLAAAGGRSSTEIAAVGCNPSDVGRWRGRSRRRALTGSTTSRGRQAAFRSATTTSRVIVKTSSAAGPMRRTGRRVRWRPRRDEPKRGQSYLAGVRVEAHQLGRQLSRIRSSSTRCATSSGLLNPPRRGRLVRRREVADPGARPLGAVCR